MNIWDILSAIALLIAAILLYFNFWAAFLVGVIGLITGIIALIKSRNEQTIRR